MGEKVKVIWLDRLLAELGQNEDTELGQELVRCITNFDLTRHPSYVDMAVYKSYKMWRKLPDTIQELAAYQANERLNVGPRGNLSTARREEARKLAMTTMTSLVAAGLCHPEASLRTAEALRDIYKIQPYTDSTIRRHHLKYRKTVEGKALAETMRSTFEENPDFKEKLLQELKMLPSLAPGVYN
jgi:hypothetical protein